MTKRKIGAACGTALLIAAAVVVALRERQQPAPLPDVPVAQTPAAVRVKAVERKAETVERENVTASGAVVIVCGEDAATADSYEARNDALRSIARRRDLAKNDVDALLAYLRSADDALRVERVAALKNDVICTEKHAHAQMNKGMGLAPLEKEDVISGAVNSVLQGCEISKAKPDSVDENFSEELKKRVAQMYDQCKDWEAR